MKAELFGGPYDGRVLETEPHQFLQLPMMKEVTKIDWSKPHLLPPLLPTDTIKAVTYRLKGTVAGVACYYWLNR